MIMQAKYDIVVVAGQSNAAGTGYGETDTPYIPNDNVMMVVDDANPYFDNNEEGIRTLFINVNTPFRVTAAEECANQEGVKLGQFQLAFAKLYYDTYLRGTDRKVLIVQAAVGGTCFARKEWGSEGAVLFDRLVKMTEYALSLNGENRLKAFLWHQGESDTFENADWEPNKRYETHKKNLTEMFNSFCSRFDCQNIPLITAGFVPEWYEKFKEPANAVYAAIKEVLAERNGVFVDTALLKSNNEQLDNGDDIHFSRDALQKLGGRYFDAFVRLMSQNKSNN